MRGFSVLHLLRCCLLRPCLGCAAHWVCRMTNVFLLLLFVVVVIIIIFQINSMASQNSLRQGTTRGGSQATVFHGQMSENWLLLPRECLLVLVMWWFLLRAGNDLFQKRMKIVQTATVVIFFYPKMIPSQI